MDLDGKMDNPVYKESLRRILQGSGSSVRHQLFQDKKQRSGYPPPSQLQMMAGPQFLGKPSIKNRSKKLKKCV